jgi:hypothetical protein
MKKKVESELVSIAHRILKLKGKEDVLKMHAEVAVLYEKLTVLKFANENFEEDIPTIGNDSSFFGMLDSAFNNKISDNIEVEDKTYVNVDENENEAITEPLMETIKDMVAEMPPEAAMVDNMFEEAIKSKSYDQSKNDFEEITSDYRETPVFEAVSDQNNEKKSLNDKLKSGGLKIGLNDKIAFINHLFEGNADDYNRVLSQLNTSTNFKEASELVQNMVKPDYNNWTGKEDYETRFMEILEARFE